MKIYDCFTFYNELDLLEIRLTETYDQVDKFVIVESVNTFQNTAKPLYFLDNRSRYTNFLDKIIHVIVDNPLGSSDPWANERHQREEIKRGLRDVHNEDYVIIGDVDEILRATTVERLRESKAQSCHMRIPYFNFKLNYLSINDRESYCIWNLAVRAKNVTSIEDLRLTRLPLNQMQLPKGFSNNEIEIFEHAGWHFSYMGDNSFIVNKLKSFAHSEFNNDEILKLIDVESMIDDGRGFNPGDRKKFVPVRLNQYFTETLHDSKWSKYVLPAEHEIEQFLK